LLDGLDPAEQVCLQMVISAYRVGVPHRGPTGRLRKARPSAAIRVNAIRRALGDRPALVEWFEAVAREEVTPSSGQVDLLRWALSLVRAKAL
jgi:hypothetical protein